LRKIFAPFHSGAQHNEADTEERIIYPVLSALGWENLILRKNTMAEKGRDDVPDALLLPDDASLKLADKSKQAGLCALDVGITQ
jgi:predicted type IV restriction endonuclease